MSFDKKVDELKDTASSFVVPGINPIKFTDTPLKWANSPNLIVSHAVDMTRADTIKLIYHFKNISMSDMNRIGKILYDKVKEWNMPTVFANGSPSPIYRNQWDFIMFDVPLIRAVVVQQSIMTILQNG